MRYSLLTAGVVCLTLAAACSSGSGSKPATGGGTDADTSTAAPTESATAATSNTKVAILLAGPINDNDWNYVQYQALQAVKDQNHAATAYNESVAVADAPQVGKQFVANGYNVVIFSANQFLNAAENLARANSDVTVLGEDATGAIPDQPKNLWVLQLSFEQGEYALGYAAGLAADGGKACFISGLSVPSTIGAANAALLGMKAANSSVRVAYTFTGDFNDSTKSRQAAAALINDGCTTFVVHLNGAVPGVVQAIKDSGKDIKWLGLYTDKHDMDTSHYMGGLEFDFTKAYTDIVGKIQSGVRSGSYDLGSEIELTPLYNVTDDQKAAITKAFDDVKSGSVKVPVITDKVQVPSS